MAAALYAVSLQLEVRPFGIPQMKTTIRAQTVHHDTPNNLLDGLGLGLSVLGVSIRKGKPFIRGLQGTGFEVGA
ncbi:MAG: hypothetical protein M1819_004453 [Sarea resinae]|nr:MAG: hypothetical protein M1819_004453 [Sarea resinae]